MYKENYPGLLKVYLKLIDVEQTDLYSGLPQLRLEKGENSSFFESKRNALLMHQTQADASFYGIKRLEKFPFEHYLVEYNSMDSEDPDIAFLNKNLIKTIPDTAF